MDYSEEKYSQIKTFLIISETWNFIMGYFFPVLDIKILFFSVSLSLANHTYCTISTLKLHLCRNQAVCLTNDIPDFIPSQIKVFSFVHAPGYLKVLEVMYNQVSKPILHTCNFHPVERKYYITCLHNYSQM